MAGESVLEKAMQTAGSAYRIRELSAGGSPYRKESLLVQGLGTTSSKEGYVYRGKLPAEGRGYKWRSGSGDCRKTLYQ